MSSSPQTVATLAEHAARISSLEKKHSTLDDRLDSLKNWIMATLAAGVIGIGVQLLRH